MEKRRRKKRSNQDIASNRLKSNGITQHIIAKAIVEAEEIRAQKEEENQEKYRDELFKLAGYKDYESKIKRLRNGAKTYLKMPIIYVNMLLSESSMNPVKKDTVSIAVLKFFVAALFGLVASFLLVVSVCSFLSIFNQNTFLEIWTFLCFTIFTLLFSFMFGVIALEIFNSGDRNYIFSMSSLALSIISIIIAIISLVRSS